MRLAIFSDVHGNWTAIQEVWAAIEAEGGFDAVVCAADQIARMPWIPAQVASGHVHMPQQRVIGGRADWASRTTWATR